MVQVEITALVSEEVEYQGEGGRDAKPSADRVPNFVITKFGTRDASREECNFDDLVKSKVGQDGFHSRRFFGDESSPVSRHLLTQCSHLIIGA